ncbi:MAG TPA: hypothetical protein PK390_05380, partial [Fervidobacterium nodosum]|nr:hypothetical protein [Fervidobacterium nodosum]
FVVPSSINSVSVIVCVKLYKPQYSDGLNANLWFLAKLYACSSISFAIYSDSLYTFELGFFLVINPLILCITLTYIGDLNLYSSLYGYA